MYERLAVCMSYVGVCVYEACGFVCGVGELLGWYGVEGTGAARGL